MRSEPNSPARRGHKKETTCGFLLLVNLPLSLREPDTDRRPATASKMGNGSRVTVAWLSPPFRSSQIAYCYTGGSISAGATQGELPEGQEKVPWGITVSRNSFVWILRTAPTDFTYPSTPTSYLAEPLTLTPTKKENPPGFSFFITPYP